MQSMALPDLDGSWCAFHCLKGEGLTMETRTKYSFQVSYYVCQYD